MLSRPSSRSRAIIVFVGTGLALFVAAPATLAGGVQGSGGKIGMFTFGGELQGAATTDKSWNADGVTVAGCQITIEQTDSNIYFFNTSVKIAGHSVALLGAAPGTGAFLDVEAGKLGSTESLTPPDYTGSVNFGAYINGKDYQWLTNADNPPVKSSGMLTTNAQGTGGTVNATLVPVAGTAAKSTLTIKGSWSYCRALPR